MKQVTAREFIRITQKNGWRLDRVKGSHHHFVKQASRPSSPYRFMGTSC
ncbi:MAG: type II toxin-antitoxin system HicA family toxin [Candidatus Glassbacteria bacterium]